jgi:hypothetical protein
MATKKFFFKYGTFSIKDESQIRFWEDSWLGNRPLSEQYPTLYSIGRRKSDTIYCFSNGNLTSVSDV